MSFHIKYAVRAGACCALFFLAGCATPISWPARSDRADTRHFRVILDSDPSGAEVFWSAEANVRSVGTTPCSITIPFQRRPVDGFLGQVGVREWVPIHRQNQPRLVRREGDVYVVHIPGLQIRKDGFDTETFSGEWRLPVSLKERVNTLEWVDVPIEHRHTVVLRTPTRPQFRRTLTLETAQGPAQVFALDSQNGVGPLIGETPLSFNFGFAAMRCEEGLTQRWNRWDEGKSGLWTHDKEGNLYLSAVLKREGFTPELIQHHPVLRVSADQPENHQAPLYLTQPDQPQSAFTLLLDSLPSGADVYALREDGSLGQKVGQTPIEVIVGLAQQLRRSSGGGHEHADWIIWAPDGIMRWEYAHDQTANVFLSCALYKDGFAVENVIQTVFQLRPGSPFPEHKVLTIPLLRPEQAAAREAQRARMIPAPAAPTPAPDADRRAFIWQAPASEHGPRVGQREPDDRDDAEPPSWWQRILPRRFRGD